MIKVDSEAELDRLLGSEPDAEPDGPANKAPAPAATAVDPEQFAQMQAAMVSMAAGIERTAALVAQAQQQQPAPPAPPKKLDAIVHRDVHGRMTRVEITVVQ